jgi:MmyB-like transcription regulator ligand binding domain
MPGPRSASSWLGGAQPSAGTTPASRPSTTSLVGDVTCTYESMELTADHGLTMFVYTPEPGSKSEQALNLLASWAATPDEEITHADHEKQPRHSSRAE